MNPFASPAADATLRPDDVRRVAVVPVREGALPAGGLETVAEAGGTALLVGEGAVDAATALAGVAIEVAVLDLGVFAPAAYAARLAPLVAEVTIVLLPASADGRDLAPRLAAELERPLYANAMQLHTSTVTLVRHDGSVLAEQVLAGPCVVTQQPGVRTVVGSGDGDADGAGDADDAVGALRVEQIDESTGDELTGDDLGVAPLDATSVAVLAPDVATMDLSEAPRILGGGAGLDSARRFDQLTDVAVALGASMGATRVITDRGWIGHSRQIGTTGVVVDPELYISFGISGAVQHTAGLGDPAHIISVNLDPHCPMMEMADLAVVADANETLDELASLLDAGAERPDGEHGDD